MKKWIATLALTILPCLLLSSCNAATEPDATTAATTEGTPAPQPAEERYTDESGRYVCKNVAIGTEMGQNFVPHRAHPATDTEQTLCLINQWIDSTVAIVKKTASESYYTAYEDGRTPLAYTLTTVEIVSLPEGAANAFALQAGDLVTVVEPYAFAPDAPDTIYRPKLIQRFSGDYGLMEIGGTYLVNLTDTTLYTACYETGKEPSELPAMENCYSVCADIYPVDEAVYTAWVNDAAPGDLAFPTAYSELQLSSWSTVYQQAYRQYVKGEAS